MRLDDGVLIKDNHVAVCGGVAEAVKRAKAANTGFQVQVEVDSSRRSNRPWPRGRTACFSTTCRRPVLREAVALVAGRVPLEASGGVNLDTIRPLPRRVSTSFRRAGLRNRRLPST